MRFALPERLSLSPRGLLGSLESLRLIPSRPRPVPVIARLLSSADQGRVTAGQSLFHHIIDKGSFGDDLSAQDLADLAAFSPSHDETLQIAVARWIGRIQSEHWPRSEPLQRLYARRLYALAGQTGWLLRILRFNDAQEQLVRMLDAGGETLYRASQRRAAPTQPLIEGVEALIALGLLLEGRDSWVQQAEDDLTRFLERILFSDGGHATRSPAEALASFRSLVRLMCVYTSAERAPPVMLQHALDRMAPALRFFRPGDRNLAHFHGTLEADGLDLDRWLEKSGCRGRPPKRLPESGYERLHAGKTLVLFDAGGVPRRDTAHTITAPHRAPLAFEMSYGSHRMIVNCGSHRTDPLWQDLLAGTAAHSTLCIDSSDCDQDGALDQNGCVRPVDHQETDDAQLVDAVSDGYNKRFGIIHRRRLYLCRDGADLRGEDNLTCTVGLMRPHNVHVRFHLHPKVAVSAVQKGREALLLVGGRIGWRFVHDGGHLSIEDSVYCSDGIQPQRTKQLVITTPMTSDTAQIKWALQKEGDTL